MKINDIAQFIAQAAESGKDTQIRKVVAMGSRIMTEMADGSVATFSITNYKQSGRCLDCGTPISSDDENTTLKFCDRCNPMHE